METKFQNRTLIIPQIFSFEKSNSKSLFALHEPEFAYSKSEALTTASMLAMGYKKEFNVDTHYEVRSIEIGGCMDTIAFHENHYNKRIAERCVTSTTEAFESFCKIMENNAELSEILLNEMDKTEFPLYTVKPYREYKTTLEILCKTSFETQKDSTFYCVRNGYRKIAAFDKSANEFYYLFVWNNAIQVATCVKNYYYAYAVDANSDLFMRFTAEKVLKVDTKMDDFREFYPSEDHNGAGAEFAKIKALRKENS